MPQTKQYERGRCTVRVLNVIAILAGSRDGMSLRDIRGTINERLGASYCE